MKPLKIKFLKGYNAILGALLALLGFASACDSKDEYGTPSATFVVKGKIVSAATELPIENIRVVMNQDTAFSDAEGAYQVVEKNGFPDSQTFQIHFQDVDGALNGAFYDLDAVATFKDPEFSGGDGDWYSGETSVDFDVKLTPKDDRK